jgi:hypothetical protein
MDALIPSTRLIWRVCLWLLPVIAALSATPCFSQAPAITSQPQSYAIVAGSIINFTVFVFGVMFLGATSLRRRMRFFRSTRFKGLMIVLASAWAGTANAGVIVNVGDGLDGDFVVASNQTVTWETLTNVVSTLLVSSTQTNQELITVGNTTGFNSGDELLLYVYQAKDATGAAGQYETFHVTGAQGTNILTLDHAPTAIYDPSQEVVTVFRVPNFNNVTINGTLTASWWNRISGGIIFFRAEGTLNIAGTITAAGTGFRGGPPTPVAGLSSWSLDGFGSSGVDYGGAGLLGADLTFNHLLLGSGGGGGGYAGGGGNGGNGGGLIYAAAHTIAMTGSINDSGYEGGGGVFGSQGGGGGSGGEVWLQCRDASGMTSTVINRSGGSNYAPDHGTWGGLGGSGLSRLDFFTGPVSYAGADLTNTVDSDNFGAPQVFYNGIPTPPLALPNTNSIQISMQTSFTNGHIRYSLDGSDPHTGISYSGPFNATVPDYLQAIGFDSNYVNSASITPVNLTYLPLIVSIPGGGTVTNTPPSGSYLINSSVTLNATANSGWTFMDWAGDSTSSNPAVVIPMSAGKSVTAVFGTSINTSTSGGGSIVLNPAAGPYPYGSVIRCTAVPNSGKYLAFWGGAASGGSGNPLNFTVTNASPTISAVFSTLPANQFSLTVLTTGNGTVTENPFALNYTNGQTVTLTAVPDSGYVFMNWSNDASGSANPLNLTMNTNKTVTAVFAPAILPTIYSQPQSTAVIIGSNATFTVGAAGAAPLAYQWLCNGSNIVGAVSATLLLGNVMPAQSGNYNVIITNAYGSVTSSVVQLTTCTKLWTGGGDGQSWSDANNWNGGVLPNSADSIFIGSGTNTITGLSLGTLNNLICQRTIAINSSLTVTGSVQIAQASYAITQAQYATGVNIIATGTNAAFVDLGTVDTTTIGFLAQNGGLVRLPALTNYSSGVITMGCSLQATGFGSLVDLPALKTITGPSYARCFLTLQALQGGRLNLTNVSAMYCSYYNYGNWGDASGIVISADGTNSTVDLTGLQLFSGNSSQAAAGSQMQPSNGGQILVPNFKSATGLSLYVAGGMTFSLPALTNYNNGGYGSSCTFQAIGAGSLLDLPALQSITGSTYASSILNLQALQGARLNLKNVTAIYCLYTGYGNDGHAAGVVVSADGTNSVVDLTGLQLFSGISAGAACGSQMQPSNGGQILLSNLRKVTGLNFYVSGGQTFSLPALTNLSVCTMIASGTGSLLDLTAFRQISVVNYFQVLAQSGALVNLSGLTNIANGTLYFDANGAGSIINLLGLMTFTGPGTLSQESGGLILLNANTTYQNVSQQLAPYILSPLQSAFAVGNGLNVTYSIAVSATTPIYQWLSNNIPVATGTNSTYVLTNVQPSWSGSGYSVVITNAYGSATSSVVTLTVPTELLHTSVNGSGQIQVSPAATNYYLGQAFTLTAAPSPYYNFVQWSDGMTNNPRPIVINSNNFYTATFTNAVPLDTYTNNGVIFQVPVGTPVVLVNGQYSPTNYFAVPATNTILVSLQTSFPNGYLFYTLDGSAPIPGDNAIPYSIQGSSGTPFTITNSTVVTAIAFSSDDTGNVEADAAPVAIAVVPVYNLTNATPGGGSVAFNPPGGTYLSNAVVTCTATASNGWTFMGWQGISTSTNNPIAVTVGNSTSISAIFGTTISTTNNGSAGSSVALWPAQGPYAYGSTVRLVGVPSATNYFSRWFSKLIGPTNNPYDLQVTNATPVASAFFGNLAANNFTLTTLLNGYGEVARSPTANFYQSNSVVQLTAVPDAGYVFTGWSGDAGGLSNPVNMTLNTNKLVTASFAFIQPPLITAQPQSLTVNRDSNAVFSVTATGPFLAYQWYFNGTNLSGATSNTVNIASFQAANAGSYFVIITNVYGSATSSVAVLALAGATNQPPTVIITNPISGAVFSSPANITLNATASDPDGSVAQVAFFSGTNLLGTLTNVPFNFTWTNATVGTNLVTAIATDNFGAATTSAVVSVTVNLPPPVPAVFSLGTNVYSVLANGGSVTVTIQKNFNSVAGVVNYATADGSAVAYANGLGNYASASGSLSFTNGQLSKTVTIQVYPTAYYVGNRTFSFQLTASGDGSSLGSPANATITIVDVNTPASTNSFPQSVFPSALPAHTGQLSVFLTPTNSGGQWRLVRETVWRNSGDTAGNLATGNYEVEFKPAAAFVAPGNTTNSVTSGALTSVTNVYAVSFDTPQFGSLTVTLTPSAAVTAGAQWRILGDSVWRNSGVTLTNLIAGQQVIEFNSAPGWVTPSMQAVTVSPNQNNLVTVNYPAPNATGGVAPIAVPFADATQPSSGAPPYPWNGQLLTDVGYGSGFVVKQRVVLTAAHVVFNDVTLSYVTGVKWFFQRYAGQYEPPTQTPRGWYVFDGYAAARTNDNSPGVSSPTSQNLDVAALYFYEDAGRGGYGGYLVSDPNGTEWLQVTGSKTLIGYPIEGVGDTARGEMYFTPALSSIHFTGVTNNVFSTSDLFGYPGMSGGPLCVQYTNNAYFPAAVYLGGSGQGIVRAIDGAVADLINKADTTANTGNNFVGGGVALLTSGSGGLFATGNFQIMITPAAAITAGAGWRVTSVTNNPGTYYSDSNATYSLPASSYTLTFHAATGYLTPPNRSLTVNANATAGISVTYTNIIPHALPIGTSNGVVQLSFSATIGQRYAIERSTNLTAWVTLGTNTVGADGILRVGDSNLTNNLQNAFYRARFVP